MKYYPLKQVAKMIKFPEHELRALAERGKIFHYIDRETKERVFSEETLIEIGKGVAEDYDNIATERKNMFEKFGHDSELIDELIQLDKHKEERKNKSMKSFEAFMNQRKEQYNSPHLNEMVKSWKEKEDRDSFRSFNDKAFETSTTIEDPESKRIFNQEWREQIVQPFNSPEE